MTSQSLQHTEGVIIVTLVVAYLLWGLIAVLKRLRPEFSIGVPIAIGFALRLFAIAAVNATGSLSAVLRGGDETTYLSLAQNLAAQPLGHGDLPHGPYQLMTVVFALQLKLGFLNFTALRITQVGIALMGTVFLAAAVYDLASARAARLAAWLMALEPTALFFDSGILKDPNMELAAGLVVFGATRIWLRLDVRGILLCALGAVIAVKTRSYAGWFLVAAAVLVVLHAGLRGMDRPLKSMPLVYGVILAAVLAAPAVIQASSSQNLQKLQASQNANAAGIGEGSGTSNSSNLALEQVNFSTRSAIITNLPKRIRDVILKPFPWQLADTSQRIGSIGTLVAYAVFGLLLWYAWQSRGKILPASAPVIYPFLFLLIAYSLSAGNAGTSFRYRAHLVTLGIAAMVILREHVLLKRVTVTSPETSTAGTRDRGGMPRLGEAPG